MNIIFNVLTEKKVLPKHDIEIELKRKTTYPVTTENLSKIFQDRIYDIAFVHKLTVSIYRHGVVHLLKIIYSL